MVGKEEEETFCRRGLFTGDASVGEVGEGDDADAVGEEGDSDLGLGLGDVRSVMGILV